MATKSSLVTAEQLLELPDDGYRYELVRGVLIKTPVSGAEHGAISANVGASLFCHVRPNGLGKAYAAETGFLIGTDPDHVRAPDAAFVRQERVDAVSRVQGFFPGAPGLAVEVISSNDPFTEVEEKVGDWLEAGTAMVVLVNPRNRTATVRQLGRRPVILTEQDTLDGGEIVPGWRLAIREIFD